MLIDVLFEEVTEPAEDHPRRKSVPHADDDKDAHEKPEPEVNVHPNFLTDQRVTQICDGPIHDLPIFEHDHKNDDPHKCENMVGHHLTPLVANPYSLRRTLVQVI